MAGITLESVRKSFGNNEVIHGIDIDIRDGEFIVIVGPSGCGKSTLLRMVAGLETVTSGDISIGDRQVNDLEPMDRDIAMVFQNYALYPHMSVFQNMAYGLKIAGTPKVEIERRVADTAKLLQLEDFLERRPRQLSGGQRQRVAMGRAIVRQPSVFLFDEPLSNLDAKLRVQMRLEIKALQQKLGVTSLYVTHDQVEAMTLAERMIVMNDGVAEQIGEPRDVYAKPATTFVAGFIGSPPMNFFGPSSLKGYTGDGDRTLGVRPEHLTLCDETRGRLSGVAKYTEVLGAETLVHLVMNNGESLTIRQDGDSPIPDPGDYCFADFESSNLNVFDSQGRRVI